jgi:hypothetical protein
MTWKDIEGYEGLYQVSDTGLVKSLKRNNTNGKVLRPVPKGKELYHRVRLSKKATVKTWFVHQLVARAFCHMTEGSEVMHLDGDRQNNKAENLRWGSRMCNAAFRVEHGTSALNVPSPLRGRPSPLRRFDQEVGRLFRFLSESGVTLQVIADSFCTSVSVVWRTIKRTEQELSGSC